MLIIRMNQEKEHHECQTPVKKWQQMSPLEDPLAIVESESSDSNELELFNELVGSTPSFREESQDESYEESLSEEQMSSQQLQEESPLPQESEKSQDLYPVSVDKEVAEKTSEKLTIRIIDPNRKGCNCKHSKCQKNYCECLRMGAVCEPGLCFCDDCHNTEQRQVHKENKKLFAVEVQVRGCNCRKSRCLKKYCECHSGGRKCGSACQCIDCLNQDENEPSIEDLRKLRKMMSFVRTGSGFSY